MSVQRGKSENGWGRRVWIGLSIANVWACGVASAQHDWTAAAAVTFFAVACWGLSSVRIAAMFDEERHS